MAPQKIAFNCPILQGNENTYVGQAIRGGHFAADGPFTRRVEKTLKSRLCVADVLLTHSCTAALEISALLTVGPGDEVILPSFAYATTASAFARCGAKLVFVDIDAGTLNIDPEAVRAAITARTKAIVAVHYAGMCCAVEPLRQMAIDAKAIFIEDAAQAFGAGFGPRALGSFGSLATLSFHETKNIVSGEGGALIVNDPSMIERARIIRDRGTTRQRFLSGEVAEYTWLELGSAYAPSDLVAAFLLAQIEDEARITSRRLVLWQRYHAAFERLERDGVVSRPVIPSGARPNGHIYYLLLPDGRRRPAILGTLKDRGVDATFHYVPLHLSPAGLKYGRCAGSLAVTESCAERLIRLPLHLGLSEQDQTAVIEAVSAALAE